MRDVRKRSDKTDNMFEPLKDTVSLLTRFGITMTDVVLKQLEEGPLAWKSLKKKMFQRYCLFAWSRSSIRWNRVPFDLLLFPAESQSRLCQGCICQPSASVFASYLVTAWLHSTSFKDAYWCRREVLAPLQQAEAIDIRRKSDAFGEKVEDFRKFFQQKAPFSVPGGELKLEHVSGSV